MKLILAPVKSLCPSQNSCVEVFTPSTSECDLLSRWGLNRGNQVEVNSLNWALTQYDWCCYKKQNLDTETHTEQR